MTAVHVVVPDGIDDPARPSGGNVYDRRVCRGLAALGWSVHEHAGARLLAAARRDGARGSLGDVLAGDPRRRRSCCVDGLIASAAPEVLVPAARRLRLVVLVHMPLGDAAPGDDAAARARERAVLSAAAAVVTTSAWTRRWLLDRYALRPGLVHVARARASTPPRSAPGTRRRRRSCSASPR